MNKTRVEEVILYGSRVKDTYKPASDIDLVLKGEKLTQKDQLRLENDLILPWKFDISLFHQISNPDLIDHINRVGVMVYRKPERVSEKSN